MPQLSVMFKTVSTDCNLDCAYCNEFDKVSKPVPVEELIKRVDALAALGTQIVTLTGGGYDATAVAAESELLSRILGFFEMPKRRGLEERLPPCLWSGSWAQ